MADIRGLRLPSEVILMIFAQVTDVPTLKSLRLLGREWDGDLRQYSASQRPGATSVVAALFATVQFDLNGLGFSRLSQFTATRHADLVHHLIVVAKPPKNVTHTELTLPPTAERDLDERDPLLFPTRLLRFQELRSLTLLCESERDRDTSSKCKPCIRRFLLALGLDPTCTPYLTTLRVGTCCIDNGILVGELFQGLTQAGLLVEGPNSTKMTLQNQITRFELIRYPTVPSAPGIGAETRGSQHLIPSFVNLTSLAIAGNQLLQLRPYRWPGLETMRLKSLEFSNMSMPIIERIVALLHANQTPLERLSLFSVGCFSGYWATFFQAACAIKTLTRFELLDCRYTAALLDFRSTPGADSLTQTPGFLGSQYWGDHHALRDVYAFCVHNRQSTGHKGTISSTEAESWYMENLEPWSVYNSDTYLAWRKAFDEMHVWPYGLHLGHGDHIGEWTENAGRPYRDGSQSFPIPID